MDFVSPFQDENIYANDGGYAVQDVPFLCDPYKNDCPYDDARPYNTEFALLTQYFVSMYLIYSQYREFQNTLVGGGLYGLYWDLSRFPFIHANRYWTPHAIWWIAQALWVNSLQWHILYLGLTGAVFQGPHFFRKWFTVAVSFNAYRSVFLTTCVFAGTGY